MTKKIILLLLISAPWVLKAQITISTQIPSSGLVPKDQLWNLILVNNKDPMTDLVVKMNMQDAVTGEILMSAGSGSFSLGNGVKIITSRDVEPIAYNYAMENFNRSYLPMGAYIVCYQVIDMKVGQVLGEECAAVNIDPLSPPLLNFPADRSDIETPYPQFTWMPPTVIDQFTNLAYEILVTELTEGQSPAEAIQYNSPVYWRADIHQPNENYPASYAALENGKTYAWQIIARNGRQYAAKTEVWTFRVNKDKVPEKPLKGAYILLKDEVTGIHTVQERKLNIKYYSFDNEYETVIVFTDTKGKHVKEMKRKIIHGDNYFDFDLGRAFRTGETYSLTIKNKADKPYTLKFSLK